MAEQFTSYLEETFNTGITRNVFAKKITNEKILVGYRDQGNTDFGTVQVLTINPDTKTTTAGAKFVFSETAVSYITLEEIGTNKFLLTFIEGATLHLKSKVLIVDTGNNTITHGTEFAVKSDITSYCGIKKINSNQFLLIYNYNSRPKAIVLTVNTIANTITAGTEFEFYDSQMAENSIKEIGNNKFLVAFAGYSGRIFAKVLIVDTGNNTITGGTLFTVTAVNGTAYIALEEVITNKFLAVYKGKSKVLIVNPDTNTITAGTEFTYDATGQGGVYNLKLVFQENYKVAVFYNRYLKILTVDPTTDTVIGGTQFEFNDGSTETLNVIKISETKNENLAIYSDLANSYFGKTQIMIFSLKEETFLLQDGNDIKAWNGTNWVTVGTAPATEAMFLSNISDSILNADIQALTSENPEILVYTDDATETVKNVSESFIPTPQLIKATGDITLNKVNIEKLDGITITGTETGAGKVRMVVSTDQGATWKKWSGTEWVNVTDTAWEVLVNGNTIAEINALPQEALSVLYDSEGFRFAYVLDVTNETDVSKTNQLSLTYDMRGYFEQTDKTDVTTRLRHNVIQLHFNTAGSYLINYSK